MNALLLTAVLALTATATAASTAAAPAVPAVPAFSDPDPDPVPDPGLSAPVPPAVETALRAASPFPSARMEILSYAPNLPCAPTSAEAAGNPPGRVAVRLHGACGEGWAWAEVRLHARTLVTTRPLARGEKLEGAVRLEEHALSRGEELLQQLPEGARTARPLRAGALVQPRHLAGIEPGTQLPVLVRRGSLSIESTGRAVRCERGLTCAILPSGARVEGTMHGGVLQVELP